MKKGFTLIELLAVIVILAVIAVIAVPIVLNIIEDAKESAALRSAEFYRDGVEMTIATSILKNKEVKDGTYSITEDGNLCIGAYLNTTCTGDILNIEVNGNKPNRGYIKIENGTIKDIGVSISDKVIVKNEKEELVLGERLKTKYTSGLYNENDELIKTWEELNEIAYNMYGMNFETLVGEYEVNDYYDGGRAGEVIDSIEGASQLVLDDSLTKIKDLAFCECSKLKNIIIPDSVTSIGDAFYMSSIESITIGSGVTEIVKIEDCWQLTTIIIDPDNPVFDSRDNCNAIIETATNTLIQGCAGTVIPDSVTSIGYSAFFKSAPTSITIPSSVTSIGNSAFEESYLETIKVDPGNKVYDSRDNCNAIIETATNTLIVGSASTTIPSSVTSIGKQAFYYVDITEITIPSSVTSIGDSAFNSTYSLETITIQEGVTSIGNYAFSSTYLETITIPSSVTSIGDYAFAWNWDLTEVTILSNEVNIPNNAFYHCDNLTTIYYKGDTTGATWIPKGVTVDPNF